MLECGTFFKADLNLVWTHPGHRGDSECSDCAEFQRPIRQYMSCYVVR